MTLLPHKVQASLETLCAEGCRKVHSNIARLEQGKTLATTITLTTDERRLLLEELKTIMAVYDTRLALPAEITDSRSNPPDRLRKQKNAD